MVMTVIALSVFTYHSMCDDHLLPIFLQDERAGDEVSLLAASPTGIPGGLGSSTVTVGIIMSLNGVIDLFNQGCRISSICYLAWDMAMFHHSHPASSNGVHYCLVPYPASQKTSPPRDLGLLDVSELF